MAKKKEPITPAVRALRQAGIDFQGHLYHYEAGGGTAQFAREFAVDEHQVIKTLVMQDENANPLIVLMHGDREVSTKALARHLGRKSIQPCDPSAAQRYTGYQVGGTSPFGTRCPLPVYCESTIFALERVYINGGKRGYIISLATPGMLALLQPELVEVGIG